MKLRNKKTGEIKEWDFIGYFNEVCGKTYGQWECDLKEFIQNAENFRNEWEDVQEEPKECWYIDFQGIIRSAAEEEYDWFKDNEIGNYFETKEEAEKVVEKLKALTEAKEDGLKIKGYYYNHEDLVILADIGKCNKLTLDTLFGKEID